MTDILTQFFNALSGNLGVDFFLGFLSLYVSGVVIILLIDPIMD